MGVEDFVRSSAIFQWQSISCMVIGLPFQWVSFPLFRDCMMALGMQYQRRAAVCEHTTHSDFPCCPAKCTSVSELCVTQFECTAVCRRLLATCFTKICPVLALFSSLVRLRSRLRFNHTSMVYPGCFFAFEIAELRVTPSIATPSL